MKNKKYSKQPLYRRNNSTAHGSEKNVRDYTPLFMFLLSKVGCSWDEVYSEAKSRLDIAYPIFFLVNNSGTHSYAKYVRCGESSYYSALYIDEQGLLQKVDPTINEDSLEPNCKCCTHTFNGKPFTKKYKERKSDYV